MANPDPEWLLWREQYKIHSKTVSHQLSSLTEATSQVENLITSLAGLATKSSHLEAQNEALNDRIALLESIVKQQNKTNERLQADNDAFRRRIVSLEQEASQQDQINNLSSHAKDEIEERLGKLKADFLNVIEAVGTMQETTKADRERQRKEWSEMKTRMEDFMNSAAQTHPPPCGKAHMEPSRFSPRAGLAKDIGPRDFALQSASGPRTERAAREASQASTAGDSSMEIDQEKVTQLLDTTQLYNLPGTTQLYTQYVEETEAKTNLPRMDLQTQGSRPIEEYVKYGDVALTEGIRSYEVQAVKTFVNGLRDKYAQRLLSGKLDKVGWKWEKAKEELERMIEDGRKRKRNRRSMPAVFYG